MAFNPHSADVKFFQCPPEKVEAARLHFQQHGWCVVHSFLFDVVAHRMRNYLLSHLMPNKEWFHSSQHGGAVGTQYVQDVPKNAPTVVHNRAEAAKRTGKHLHYSFTRTMQQPPNMTNATFQQFFDLCGGERFLQLVATITGLPVNNVETLFASKYVTGDFLDPHSDSAPGTTRQCAFVLNLSHDWKEEYGGNLIIDNTTVLVPGFNNLVLFDVRGAGRLHYVSQVTDKTDDTRLAISGWLDTNGPSNP